MSVSVASKVPFHELTGLLERISIKSGTEEKKRQLKKFIDLWREFHFKSHGKDDVNLTDSFFPAMRLLLPHLEKDRDAYGIKEHTLAKLYIEILGLGKDSPDAHKLLNFRAPRAVKGDAGDFATVAYFVLRSRCPEKGELTIEDVNKCLDGVSESNARKNKEGVRRNLLHMLKNMSAQEQKWLIRMIMKEMKMGLSQQSVFSIFHQDAEDVYNVKMSLHKVCTMLMDPTTRMHEIEVSLFSPFRPMLGDRGFPKKVEKVMEGKPFIIETKFDGERMQLHKNGDEYKYFSRGGNEYTHVYGATAYDGNFSCYIANCFDPSVKSCILDGEMVGFNPETGVRGSKGENFDIKSATEKEYQPMLCVFDVLLLNDKVLSNKPLHERKVILKDVFTPVEGRLVISEYKEGRTNQDCADALNVAIDNREEGIMIKNPDSVYKPNTRKGGWYKIKPEYVTGLMDELDLLIIGGYFGKGSRGSGSDRPSLTHFLCGLAVKPEEGEKSTVFHSFCKVGSGYTHKELQQLNHKISGSIQPFNKTKLPQCYVLATGWKQKPDFWIQPEKSFIVQVKAAEITISDQFKTGCTLRFPRVEHIRYDKHYYDCMTLEELDDLRQKAEGKLAGRYELGEDNDEEPKKKKRKIVSRAVKPTVAAHFKAADVTNVTKISEIFADKEICVLNGPASNPKATLEKKIVEYGGTVVQNPGHETFCVLVDKMTIKVRNIISKGIYDVVKVEWLLQCVDSKHFIPWNPSHMIHTSPTTSKVFAQDYDPYGDSYTKDTTADELRKVFTRVADESKAEVMTPEEIAEIEMSHFPQDSMFGLFRLCRLYLDDNHVIGDPTTHIASCSLELTGLDLRFHGATIEPKLNKDVSHVVLHSSNLERLKKFREMNKERSKKFYIVTEKWVQESIEKEKMLKERSYEPI